MENSAKKEDRKGAQAPESIGRRIAQLRQEQGWTQQALAGRLSISRVAVSHIEMDLSLPSERTVTLLAGLFKLTPYALVEGSTYPAAKAERLPEVACCYTQLELELALLDNDLDWLQSLEALPGQARRRESCREKWSARLEARAAGCIDPQERKLLSAAQKRLAEGCAPR